MSPLLLAVSGYRHLDTLCNALYPLPAECLFSRDLSLRQSKCPEAKQSKMGFSPLFWSEIKGMKPMKPRVPRRAPPRASGRSISITAPAVGRVAPGSHHCQTADILWTEEGGRDDCNASSREDVKRGGTQGEGEKSSKRNRG